MRARLANLGLSPTYQLLTTGLIFGILLLKGCVIAIELELTKFCVLLVDCRDTYIQPSVLEITISRELI